MPAEQAAATLSQAQPAASLAFANNGRQLIAKQASGSSASRLRVTGGVPPAESASATGINNLPSPWHLDGELTGRQVHGPCGPGTTNRVSSVASTPHSQQLGPFHGCRWLLSVHHISTFSKLVRPHPDWPTEVLAKHTRIYIYLYIYRLLLFALTFLPRLPPFCRDTTATPFCASCTASHHMGLMQSSPSSSKALRITNFSKSLRPKCRHSLLNGATGHRGRCATQGLCSDDVKRNCLKLSTNVFTHVPRPRTRCDTQGGSLRSKSFGVSACPAHLLSGETLQVHGCSASWLINSTPRSFMRTPSSFHICGAPPPR